MTGADGSVSDILSNVLEKPRQDVQPKTSGNDETGDLPNMKNEYPLLRRKTLLYFEFGACRAVLWLVRPKWHIKLKTCRKYPESSYDPEKNKNTRESARANTHARTHTQTRTKK